MLKNNKNGITLVALIATIMVIIILTTTAVVSYSSFSVNAKKRAFANEIYTLQKQVEDYKFRNNKYPIGNAKEVSISSLDSQLVSIFNTNGEQIQENKVTFYEIDFEKLDLDSLTRGMNNTSNDIYLFSNESKKVYYIVGEKIGDKTYYFLDDELYDSLKLN